MPYTNIEARRKNQREWKAKERHPGLHTCPSCKQSSWKWIESNYILIEGHVTLACPSCGVIIAVKRAIAKEQKEEEQK